MKKGAKKWFIPLTAAAFSAGLSMVSLAAGWSQENGEWYYYTSEGGKETDAFRRSGNNWFYLGSDGTMVKSSIVEQDGNYYYVNSAGAMVSNEWREVANEDGGDGEPDTWWYYLQSNGRAVKNSGSDSVKIVTLPTLAGNAKFIFDEDGHMLTGWISEDGEMLTGDDAWQNGVYYCDPENGGRMVNGAWKYLTAEDGSRYEPFEYDGKEYLINTSGKIMKKRKNIKDADDRYYCTDSEGVITYSGYEKYKED